MYYIYKFINKINGKIYIGKTNDVKRRSVEHLSESKIAAENNYFYNAIRKHGFDNFDLEILGEYENENVSYEMECYFIALYRANDKNVGYNSTIGGEGLRGISEETRRKMSESAKLRVGEKNGFFGKAHTNNSRNKIGAANKGNQSWLGKHHSENVKHKISIAKMGVRSSPNTEFKPGQTPANAKINYAIAQEIREKSKSGFSNEELMEQYDLSRASIWRILTNKTFKV